MHQYEISVPQKRRRRRHHLPIALQGAHPISYLFTYDDDNDNDDRSLQCNNNTTTARIPWIQSRNNTSKLLYHHQLRRHHHHHHHRRRRRLLQQQSRKKNDEIHVVDLTFDTQTPIQKNNRINNDTTTISTSQSSKSDTKINHHSSPTTTASSSSSSSSMDDIQIVPLYQGYGTHYVDLWCGTPIAQRQTMIVDTGSSTTAFACTPYCTPHYCGHIGQYHPLYKPIESHSFHKINHCNDCTIGECRTKEKKIDHPNEDHPNNIYGNNNPEYLDTNNHSTNMDMEYECVWNTAYQEGSNWTAFEAMDLCYIGGLHNKPIILMNEEPSNTKLNHNNNNNQNQNYEDMTTTTKIHSKNGIDPYNAAKLYTFQLQFGCQIELHGNFRTQDTAGIMGFNIGYNSIYNQMYHQNIIQQRTFALCMLRPMKINPLSSNNNHHYHHNTLFHNDHPAGIMTLGGSYTLIHHHPMIYATMDDKDRIGLYTTQLQSIYLRSSGIGDNRNSITDIIPISLSNLQNSADSSSISNIRKVIIDSGTTDTYLLQQYVKCIYIYIYC
jgi:hypothetical protein